MSIIIVAIINFIIWGGFIVKLAHYPEKIKGNIGRFIGSIVLTSLAITLHLLYP